MELRLVSRAESRGSPWGDMDFGKSIFQNLKTFFGLDKISELEEIRRYFFLVDIVKIYLYC